MRNIKSRQTELIDSLRGIDPSITVHWDETRGVCGSVRGNLWSAPRERGLKKARSSPEKTLGEFLERYGELFGVSDLKALSQKRTQRRTDDLGWTHLVLQQSVQLGEREEQLEVYGSRLAAHFDQSGNLIEVQSSLWRDLQLDTTSVRITPKELPDIVLKKISDLPGFAKLKERMIRSKRDFPLTDRPRLVVYPWQDRFRLVWVTFGYGPYFSGRDEQLTGITFGKIFLDADTGEQILFAPTLQTAETQTTGSGLAVTPVSGAKTTRALNIVQVDSSSTHLLKDKTHGRDIVTHDIACDASYDWDDEIWTALKNQTLPVSEDTEGDKSWDRLPTSSSSAQRTSGQQPEVDVHYFARLQYEWYDAISGGRAGWDNNNYANPPVPPQTINILAHCRWPSASCTEINAYKWSRKEDGIWIFWLAFMEGDASLYDYPAGSHFIFAHEYQHAITDFTFEDGGGDPGLDASGWLGAVHEGLSDVFGALSTEQWLPGRDVSLSSPPQIFRNMAYPRDPAAHSPNKYDHFDDRGVCADDNTACFYRRGTILAHCAYLMGMGGVHQRSSRSPALIPVYGLGRQTVGGKDFLKAARIWYRAVTYYFSTHGALTGIPAKDESAFRTLRDGCVSAAIDLYGSGSLEHRNTVLAFYAVGLHPTTESYGADVTFLRWGISWDLSRNYIGMTCGDYQSLDLFVNNGGVSEWNAKINVIDPATGSPTEYENQVYCRVRNVGDQQANDVNVQFFYAKAGTAIWSWEQVVDKNGTAQTLNIGTLAAGQSSFSDSDQNAPPGAAGIKWCIPPLAPGETVDHFCLKAVVSSSNDVNPHNNEVQTNVQYTAFSAPSPAGSSFAIGNPFDDREIAVDLRLKSVLPKGWELGLRESLKGVWLKPGETRICSVRISIPPGADAMLEPPLDGSLEGHLFGDISGPFVGSLTDASLVGTSISGRLSARLPHIGSIVATLTGTIDVSTGRVTGKATGIRNCQGDDRRFCIGLEGCLRPWRRVEISQWDGKELLGGVTVQVQIPLKLRGPCASALPPTDTRVDTSQAEPVLQSALSARGKVVRLLYDGCGDFMGFVLSSCPGEKTFHVRDSGLEHLIIEACERHWTVTVVSPDGEPSGVLRVEVHC